MEQLPFDFATPRTKRRATPAERTYCPAGDMCVYHWYPCVCRGCGEIWNVRLDCIGDPCGDCGAQMDMRSRCAQSGTD